MVFRSLTRRVAAGITASLVFAMPIAAFATTDGPNFPASATNDNSVGVTAWSNPGNISANDSSYASISTGATSQYLRGKDYGFAIPSTATITGIQVTIGRRATQTGGPGARDLIVKLFKGGTGVVGTNAADTATDWPTTITAANYGSTSDLWGTTWTPAQINAAGFGVVLQADRNGETADVDYIRVRVTYTQLQTITVGTPAPANATYGSNFTVGATSDSGLSVSVTTTGGCTNVGNLVTMTSGTTNCVVHYNQAGNTNFTAAAEVTNTVTAVKKALTVTADGDSKVYGTTNTYAGTEFTTTGLINADTVASVTLNSAGDVATATVAGSPYAITPSAAVGTGLSNYIISYVDGSLAVTAAPLTITASNLVKTYGDTYVFAGNEFGTSGLLNADSVTSVTLTSAGDVATATVAGSPYAITPSAAVGTGLSNYAISYANGSFTVNPKALTITANSTSKTYGDVVVLTGTGFSAMGLVNADAVATVTLTTSGDVATATVAGSPYAITPSVAVGTGLGNYTISYVDGSLTVNPKALTITADGHIKTYGDTVVYNGNEFSTTGLINGDTVSSVTLNSAGDVATATVAGSPYAITPSAAVGTGLGNYTISYVDGSLTVNPASLTITANSTSKVYGNTMVFNGTEFTTMGLLNADSVTSVTLTSTGAIDTAPVAASPYAITPSAAVGTGLGNYTISYVDGSLTVNMGSTLTSTVLDTPTPNSTVGDSVILHATVTGFNPTGSVKFYSGATLVGSVTVSNGSGSISHVFTQAGNYDLTAEYAGDANNTGSTSGMVTVHVVDKDSPDTVTTVGVSNPAVVGTSVALTATVSGAYLPTGTVEFYDGAVLIGTGSLNGSFQATLNYTFTSAGLHNVSAHYLGDGNNNASISGVEAVWAQTIDKDDADTVTTISSSGSSLVGASVDFTATVSGAYLPTGTVEFYDGAVLIGTGSLNGSFQVTVSNVFTLAGNHDISAHYLGDGNNNASISAVEVVLVQEVRKDTPTTNTVLSVANPSTIGDTVVMTADVTGGYGPTGDVYFYDGGMFLGSGALVGGTATFSTNALAVGSHDLTAEYQGDANNNDSMSATVTVQVVQQMTSVTILGNIPTPVNAPASITFQVTVNGFFPTGSVTISDGPSNILTVPLSHGSGSFTQVFTGAQTSHIFAASYPGDVNNTASVSPSVTVLVAAPSTEVAGSQNQGGGSNRGNNLSRTATIAQFLANIHLGNLAPGSFGGADAPLAGEEKEFVCSMQRSLPRLYTSVYIDAVANIIAQYTGRSAETVAGWLRDPSVCADITTSRLGGVNVSQVTLTPFLVTSEGFPLSKNPTWNKCVTGKFTYEDIQSNPDRDNKGTPRSCADYHTGSSWYHPDLHLFFDWNVATKKLTLPAGYLIQKDEAVSVR